VAKTCSHSGEFPTFLRRPVTAPEFLVIFYFCSAAIYWSRIRHSASGDVGLRYNSDDTRGISIEMASSRTLFSYMGLTLLAGALLSNAGQAGADCLKLTTSFKLVDQLIVQSLISKFSEHDLCVQVSHVPADRATLLIEQGQIDGELFRIHDYINEIGEVAVRVEEPIVEGYGLIVGKTKVSQSDTLLAGKPVAMIRGFIWQEKVFPRRSVPVMVEDSKAGMAMLEAGRVSALLIDAISLKILVPEADMFYQRRVTPKMSAYLYLHKRHSQDLPAFTSAIQEWKKEFPANIDGF
jgi:hypothetical protein